MRNHGSSMNVLDIHINFTSAEYPKGKDYFPEMGREKKGAQGGDPYGIGSTYEMKYK